MQAYVNEVRKIEKYFHDLGMEHILSSENSVAGELSKIAPRKEKVPPGVFVERLLIPSISPTRPKTKKQRAKNGRQFPRESPSSIPGKHQVFTVDPAPLDW